MPSMMHRKPISVVRRMRAGRLIKSRYDDGGFSGGSTDRPALQRLLTDVAARRIHIIVVYKVDRLTRSLADFAKLVELFDAHGVSFVSVTQQFNTTTSMGRLTLNVLLVLCPVRAGGHLRAHPRQDRRLQAQGLVGRRHGSARLRAQGWQASIHQDEAKTVRLIFQRYLELGSVNRLVNDLKQRD